MNFWEKIKIAWATFRAVGGLNLPDAGRSSEETLNGSMSAYLSSFGPVKPIVDFEMLKILKCFWLYNPDFTQYIANVVNLGNPGHHITVQAKTDSTIAAAIDRVNESASRIYKLGVGVDGLLNQYLTSLTWSGAISSEDVVNFAARRVEKIVFVPVEQIRFRYNKDLDTYEPYQRAMTWARPQQESWMGMFKLNQETYKYFALSTIENSPYAKPPATGAVDSILKGQVPIMENIQYMAQKIGLMGLISASVVPPPRKPGEIDAEYQARVTVYIKAIKTALDGNFSKGLVVTSRDQKIEHTPVTTGANGVYELNRMSEEQVFSGMGTYPAFHGRTDSTTETFADVVYYLLTAQVANMQRVVKRRQERTYMLDLRLGGIDVDSVSLVFDKAHSRNALAEAQTDEQKFQTTLGKVRSGLITPDDGAQDLGEEAWYDVDLIGGSTIAPNAGLQSQRRSFSKNKNKTVTLEFNKRSQSYRPKLETIELWSDEEETAAGKSVVPFIKKKAQQA